MKNIKRFFSFLLIPILISCGATPAIGSDSSVNVSSSFSISTSLDTSSSSSRSSSTFVPTVYRWISFYVNDDFFSRSKIQDGETFPNVDGPEISNYEFDGWYMDSDFKTPVDLRTPIHEDLTVFGRMKFIGVYEHNYVYFVDANWWNDGAAGVSISFNEINPATSNNLGTPMINKAYTGDGKFNVWRADVPKGSKKVMFIRTFVNSSGKTIYGGAHTKYVDLPVNDGWHDYDAYRLSSDGGFNEIRLFFQ